MRTDELYSKLKNLDFVETYYIANKEKDDRKQHVLKIYDDEGKLAEVSVDQPYMLRTSYSAFQDRSLLEKQALLKILYDYAITPVDQRQSNLYFVYYNDLNNLSHFIKKLPNRRLSDEMIPIAYFKTVDRDQLESYLFNTAEFEDFPEDYRPRFTPDSFVKTIPYEEMMKRLEERYENSESKKSQPAQLIQDENSDGEKGQASKDNQSPEN